MRCSRQEEEEEEPKGTAEKGALRYSADPLDSCAKDADRPLNRSLTDCAQAKLRVAHRSTPRDVLQVLLVALEPRR